MTSESTTPEDRYFVPPSSYDEALAKIPGLTWLPWVGKNYANLPQGRRVLIVAESHYTNEQDPAKAPLSITDTEQNPAYTRAAVLESLVLEEWSARTLSTMHQLFYSPNDRPGFWGDLCFCNIVQRLMWYREGNPERPSWEDFWKGWEVFLEVVEVLQPDHVLFIGVEAANHFNNVMVHLKKDHTPVEFPEKIGSAYARTASVALGDRRLPIHFIKHCGSYFSTDLWSDYLHREARDLMVSIAASAGAPLPVPSARRLHILGMAKSSLDLRGAKAQKLELDFLRLAYAVRDFREAGEEAVGYLMVLDPTVAITARAWIEKYGTGEGVVVLCNEITGPEFEALLKEKADNALGLLQEHRFDEAERALSLANNGRELGERALQRDIAERHPGVTTTTAFPLGVQWDFCGTLELAN